MVPAKLLQQVAEQLTRLTLADKIHWQREKHDREFYVCPQGSVRFRMRFTPARVEADVIEFSVLDLQDEEIGTLLVDVEDKEGYGVLSELLFAIQRAENRGNIRFTTDELIKLLPEPERARWAPK